MNDLNLEFRNSLLYIWIEIKELVSNSSNYSDEKSLNDLHSAKMKKLALDFYKKFHNSTIPIKRIPRLFDYYSSVIILFKDGSGFLIPHFFYQQTKSNSKIDYTDIFQKEGDWVDLISNIFDFTNKITNKLSSADIKILKAITHYKKSGLFQKLDYANRNNILIHIKNLANITGLSEKWVADRFHFMLKNYILYPAYILNPFIFGLNTYFLIYDKIYDSECSFLDNLTLFNIKIDFDNILRIFQLPNIESTDDLSFSFPYESKKIEEMHLSSNLSGLSPRLSDNFKKIPNFESIKSPITKATIEFKQNSYQWIKTLEFDEEEGQKYPFLKKMTFTKRVSSTLRVLNYLARWGIIQGSFAKAAIELRISVVELMETCRFLLDNDMIAFFPRLGRIGAHNRYGLLIIDKDGFNNNAMQNLYNSLLELPLSVCFMGSGFIFAYINIPDTYITPFFRYVTQIQELIEVKYSMFISLKSWGRFSIPLPEGTTVDEFGVNFPSNIFEKLKTKSF